MDKNIENLEILQTILLKNGFRVEQLISVTSGKFNQTYICHHSSGFGRNSKKNRSVILRIAPPEDAGFLFYEKNMMAQEAEIHRIVRHKTSIPVPEIFVYDNSKKLLNHDYLIMEHLPGKPLSDQRIPPQKRDEIFTKTGEFLRELHENCTAEKYGYLGKHLCMTPQKNWKDAFKIMWEKLIDDVADCGVYDSRESFLAKGALEKYDFLFQREVSASLLHMDIWGQNILINPEGNISGIIDWDRALWGDPEIEFAVLDYCGFNNQAFWDGYGKRPENSPESKIRMMFYHLYEVQKYLVIYTLRRPQPERVNQYKNYSLKFIDQLLRMN